MATKHFFVITSMFNLYWFLAVWGQHRFIPLLVFVLLITWWHHKPNWRFVCGISALGCSVDIGLNLVGIYQFTESLLLPIWLLLLWFGFATFVWLSKAVILRYSTRVLVIVGGIGGMVSYWGGFRLDAVAWPLGKLMTMPIALLCWLGLSLAIVTALRRCVSPCSESLKEHV